MHCWISFQDAPFICKVDGKSEWLLEKWCHNCVLSLIVRWTLAIDEDRKCQAFVTRWKNHWFTDYFFLKESCKCQWGLESYFQLDVTSDEVVCSFKCNTVNTSIAVCQCMLCFDSMCADLLLLFFSLPAIFLLLHFLNLGWDRCPVVVAQKRSDLHWGLILSLCHTWLGHGIRPC